MFFNFWSNFPIFLPYFQFGQFSQFLPPFSIFVKFSSFVQFFAPFSIFFCPIFMICLIFQVSVGCGMWPFLPIRNTCLRPLLMELLSYGLSLMLRSNEPTKRMVIPRPSHVLLSVMVKLAEINIKSKKVLLSISSYGCTTKSVNIGG